MGTFPQKYYEVALQRAAISHRFSEAKTFFDIS